MTTATKIAIIRLTTTANTTRAQVVSRNGRVVGESDVCPRGHDTAATRLGVELAERLGYQAEVR